MRGLLGTELGQPGEEQDPARRGPPDDLLSRPQPRSRPSAARCQSQGLQHLHHPRALRDVLRHDGPAIGEAHGVRTERSQLRRRARHALQRILREGWLQLQHHRFSHHPGRQAGVRRCGGGPVELPAALPGEPAGAGGGAAVLRWDLSRHSTGDLPRAAGAELPAGGSPATRALAAAGPLETLPMETSMLSRPQGVGTTAPDPAARDTTIVHAAIHPAIGVARVGNSASEYLIGPETPEPPPAGTAYRDASGALKRQAARFRIYGYNAAGEVVRELTADSASIRWTVHVANRKAAWYQWAMALDVPEAAALKLPLRNAKVEGADRASLVIDGGPRIIAGKDTSGKGHSFTGLFMGVEVYLGELRTDAAGRLVFLGGRGVSATPTGSPIYDPADPMTFINADGWYDDTSDGPVTAEVSIEGRAVPVAPAWVITAPPNYAPAAFAVRTLYDLLLDLFVAAGQLPAPSGVSFADDVYPILRRLSLLQWVHRGFATQFGWGGRYPFEDPAFMARLARKPGAAQEDREAELRRQVLNSFRPPEPTDNNALPWPWIYGDAMDVPPAATPRQNASVSALQYRSLQAWAAGQFEADHAPARARPGLQRTVLQ